MRTVTFKSVFEGILRRHGLDPRGDAVSSDTGLSLTEHINARVKRAWFLWEWPEWTITEERAFRQIWNDSRQFYQVGTDGKPDEVFYIPNVATHSLVDAAYYRVMLGGAGNPPIGAPPTNTTYWEPMDTVDTYIAFDQACRRRIGETLDVYADNPAICKPARSLPHRPNEHGIQVYEAGGLATVFVRYLIPAERFTIFPYISSRTYLRGDLVYVSAQGECYQAIVTATGHDPATEFTYWRRVLFPEVLAQYVRAGAFADSLRESDTSDERDPVMLQIRGQQSGAADGEAEDEINRQINRLQAQGQNFQYLPFGVVVRRSGGAGALCTVPGYVLQGGGAYGYGPIAPTGSGATTISDQCETEWGYIPPPPPEPPGGGGGGGGGEGLDVESGITQLVNGQSYIDVVFAVPQADANWIFVECDVVNTDDPAPLNIWPGIITSKTATGFQLQLNGTPDSISYFLHWAVTEAGSTGGGPSTAATTYLLTGPASGGISVPSTAFTVQLPPATTVASPVTVTPGDAGAGGTFTPTSRVLTTAAPSATFTYTPASYGVKTISVTNDGGLTDPTSRSFTCVATAYTLTGPSTGATGVASTNFTAALPAGGVVLSPVTVMPGDSGAGGTFTPATVDLTTAAPSATFTYTPASTGAKTISVTNNRGLTNPGSLTYTATSGTMSDGDPVSTWHDSSGNGHHATQTGTARPIWKTGILGGKPVVRFTSAGLSGLNFAAPISGTGPFEMFAVMKPANPTTGDLYTLAPATDGTALGLLELVTGLDALMFGNKANIFYITPNPYRGAFHIFNGVCDAGISGALQVDGTSTPPTPGSAPATGDFNNIGYRQHGPDYSDGDIAEIILYNVSLGSPDRGSITQYLSDKYGLGLSIATAMDPSTVSGLVGWWKADAL